MWVKNIHELEDVIKSGRLIRERNIKDIKWCLKNNIEWFSEIVDGETLMHLLMRSKCMHVLPKEVITREYLLKKDEEGKSAMSVGLVSGELSKLPKEEFDALVKEEDFLNEIWGETVLQRLAKDGLLKSYIDFDVGRKALTLENLLKEDMEKRNSFQIAGSNGKLDEIPKEIFSYRHILQRKNPNIYELSPLELSCYARKFPKLNPEKCVPFIRDLQSAMNYLKVKMLYDEGVEMLKELIEKLLEIKKIKEALRKEEGISL